MYRVFFNDSGYELLDIDTTPEAVMFDIDELRADLMSEIASRESNPGSAETILTDIMVNWAYSFNGMTPAEAVDAYFKFAH